MTGDKALALGLIGAGRIGRTHASALRDLDGARLHAVYDHDPAAAAAVASMTGAAIMDIADIFADPAIDGVIIASPTDQHAGQIEAAARAGKAVFCEKPIDLDVGRVRACLAAVEAAGTLLMVGFNRRFDTNFAALKRHIDGGTIGAVELLTITSRDPAPPPLDYVSRSGGLFKDMMIHDFDMARFLLGERVVEVSATGAVLVDAAIGQLGDIDTAVATLKTASGKIAILSNSRRATYGYDQRVEVHGAAGMVAADNVRPTTVTVATGAGYAREPAMPFFMERYAGAYKAELAVFAQAMRGQVAAVPNGADGLAALELAEAALMAMAERRTVAVDVEPPQSR